MQTILYFVVMFTISVANDGNVYVYNNVNNYKNHEKPRPSVSFQYHDGDMLKMQIFLKNKPKNWNTDLYLYKKQVTIQDVTKQKKKLETCGPIERNCYEIKQVLKDKEIYIELVLFSTIGGCTRQQNIIYGNRVLPYSKRTNNTPYKDICLLDDPCVIEVDLGNTYACGNEVAVVSTTGHPVESVNTVSKETTPNKTSGSDDKSSGKQTLIYVISSVIGMCVIILAIYIGVKKYYRLNSRPVETMELNTYATVNEVVYADLSLAHGDSQPPRREESPYAQIVGVMRPLDRNVKKK